MKFHTLATLAALSAVVVGDPAPPAPAAAEPAAPAAPDVPLPAGLTLADFDALVAKQLLLVEFFSPYCHHCTAFAPTWEQTFREFKPELDKMGVQMRQVDCAAEGDLCDREQIFGFPQLRLYGPDQRDTAKARWRMFGLFPRAVEKLPEALKTYMRDLYAEFNDGNLHLPLMLRELSNDDLAKIIAGEPVLGSEPELWMVSFWAANKYEWDSTEQEGLSHFSADCMDCFEAKAMWDRTLNQVQLYYKTGHVTCADHPEVCKLLGFDHLVGRKYQEAVFAVFLPKQVGKIRWDYLGPIGGKELKAWAHRLWESLRYERVTVGGLPDIMEYKVSLPPTPLPHKKPLENRVLVVYYYDADKELPEDATIMLYALEEVMRLPFNVYLYKAKQQKFEIDWLQQLTNLVNYVNAIPGQDRKYEFERGSYVAHTLTQKPTFMVFQDDLLIHLIYQPAAVEDMRDAKKVAQFIRAAAHPLHGELTPRTFYEYFNRGVDMAGKTTVVAFVDSLKPEQFDNDLFQLLAAAHENHLIHQYYWFGETQSQRAKKQDKIAKLKDAGADLVKIIDEMRREVPNYFATDDTLFAYIDVASPNRLRKLSSAVDPMKFKAGDAVVISQDGQTVWDRDAQGKPLTNDALALRPVLLLILDPSLVDENTMSQLAPRPQGYTLSVWGWGALVVAVGGFAGWRLRKRRRRGTTGMGIIGNLEKKD